MYYLRQFIAQRELTQEKFADKIGVTQGTVSLWLNGKKRPSLTNLMTIAAVSKIPIEKLISDLRKQVA